MPKIKGVFEIIKDDRPIFCIVSRRFCLILFYANERTQNNNLVF